jgi:YD repeat-containing protein
VQRGVGTAALTTTQFSYDARGLQIGRSDGVNTALVRSVSQTVDAFGRVTSDTDALGTVTTHAYDRLGRQLSQSRTVEDRVESVSTTYDAFGRTLTQADALGKITRYLHSDSARSVTVTSPEGVAITTVHNRFGQTLTVSQLLADGTTATTTYTYNKSGVLTATTNALGEATTFTPDSRGLVLISTDASGRKVQYGYDAVGRVISRTEDPGTGKLNLTTTYAYDGQGRQLTVTDATGRVTEMSYDREGRLLQTAQDPSGLNLRTVYSYDALGRQVRVVEGAETAAARTVDYGYDELGRRTSETVAKDTLNLTTSYTFDANDNLVTRTDALGHKTRYTYDAANRLRFAIDAVGAVTENTYDANGNLIVSRTYAQPLSPSALAGLTDNVSTAEIQILVTSQGLVDNARDQLLYRVFDKDHRVRGTVDGTGAVVETLYDTAGRAYAVKRYSHAAALTTTIRANLAAGTASWAGVLYVTAADTATDQVTYNVLDAAGRVRFTLDGANGLRETRYDAAGRVLQVLGYATAFTDTVLLAKIKLGTAATANFATFVSANAGAAQTVWTTHDAAGRARFSVDLLGIVAETRYDAAGRIVETLRYPTALTLSAGDKTALSNGTMTVNTLINKVNGQQAIAHATQLVYDNAGRVVYTLTGSGTNEAVVNERRYDAVGRVIAEVAYAKTITYTLGQDAALVASALGAVGFADADQQRLTQYAYDDAGRLRFTMNDAGSVVEQRYDAAGRVVASRQYLTPISNSSVGEAAIHAAVVSQTDARQTRYEYDNVGRLTSTTDALNQTESYGYDAAGRRTVFTNKLGDIWTYEYDAAGRLTAEHTPLVTVAEYSTDTFPRPDKTVSIVTRNAYDAIGRLIARTENADNSDEARTTQYVYDARGRQIKTIFPDAWQLDVNGKLVATGVRPESHVMYDALDRAVVQKDVRNNYAYKVYDGAGRLAYDVDEAGYVTAYNYNGIGEQTGLTRYATKIDFTKLTGWTAGSAITLAKIGGTGVLKVSSVNDRTLTIEYDRLGQKTKVLQPSVSYYKFSDNTAYFGSPTTQFTYDNFGQIVKQAVLLDPTALPEDQWANTYRYYDELGRLTMLVDPEGYVTRTEYDAIGQVTEMTECARAIVTAGLTTMAPPLAPAAGDAATGYDRVTRWTYDSLGRKISETVVRHYQLANGSAGVRDVATKIHYDAVDHLTKLVVDGVETLTSYDALGRVLAVQEAERDVVRSNVGSLLSNDLSLSLESAAIYERASPYTTMAYDAFGNVIRTRRYADGLRDGSVTPDNKRDQISYMRYDRQGRAVIADDGAGGRIHRRYDAADHVVESWYVLDGNDGRWQTVRTTATIDAVGRQTRSQVQRETYRNFYDTQQSLGVVVDALENVTFNAFGEVTGKGFDGTNTPLQFSYDAAGRLISSNADGGVVRSYGYNLAGHQLRESHQALVSGNIVSAVTTQAADKLGRATRVVLPSYSDTLANGSPINQRFDRWGNVIELFDPRGYQSNYEYNELNQTTREIQALVKVVSEAGVETWQRPEKRWNYDALGRLVSERDANGNLHRTEYDAVGQAIRMLDADLHATRIAFDVSGNQRFTQDPVGHISFRAYDQLNRVISHGDFVVPQHSAVDRPSRVIKGYTLNQNGDRLAVDGDKYDYDSRHLLIRSQTAAGVITGYEYDSQGRKVHEFNAMSRVEFANYLDPVYNGGMATSRTAVVGQAITPIGIPETAFTVPSGESLKITVEVQRYNADTGLYETIEDSGLRYWSGSDDITGTVSTSGNYQIIVTATSWSSGKSVSRNISLVVGTAAEISGAPTLKSGFPDQVLTKDVAWSYQLPAGSFTDPTGQALTYSVSLRYWVPESYSNTSNSGDYETDYESYELGYWDDRPLGAGDWIQFNASTRTFSGTPPQGGDSLLVVSVTDTDGNMASTLLNVRVRVPSSGAAVYDAEDNETVYQHEQTWNYDAFGRLIDHNDLSGVDYDFAYHATTGQLTSQTNDWTTSTATATVESPLAIAVANLFVPTTTTVNTTAARKLTYYANGLLQKLVEGNSEYVYWYDASGNRTREDSTTYDANGAPVHLRSRMTYDSHNRVERVIQDDLISGKTVLDLTYSYDANGNRRRVTASGAYQDGAATIATPNRVPVVVGTPENLTLRSGVATTFRLRLADFFRDPDLDPLGVTPVLVGPTGGESSLPRWLSTSIDPITGEMVFSATTGSTVANGTNLTIKLVAQDPYGASTSVSFVLAVRSNSAPVALSGTTPIFPLTAGREVDLELAVTNYFKDADLGDSLTFSLAAGSTLPPGMSGGATSPISSVLRFAGMPTVAGVYSITVVATDQQNAIATRTIKFDVRNNHPPTAVAQEGVSFITGRETSWDSSLPSVFADSDGDALTVSATLADGSPLPYWLSFEVVSYPDGIHLRLVGEPPADCVDGSVVSVRLQAADTLDQTASTTLAITLRQNQSPELIATLPTQQARVNSLSPYWLELPVANYFTDPEGDALTLSLLVPPGDPTSQWLTLTYNAAAGVYILSGTPTDNIQAGAHAFQIVATDASGASATLNVSLQVQTDNPPVYNTGIVDRSLSASRNFSFTLPADAFTDADGDLLIYSAGKEGDRPQDREGGADDDADSGAVTSWLYFNADTRTFSGTAPGTVGQTLAVSVYVVDPLGRTATKTFVITVVASTNAAPAYTAGKLTTRSALEGELFSYPLPANTFTDANSDPLTYSAQILIGGTWLTLPQLGLDIDKTTGSLSGVLTGPTQTSYSVKVIASDGLATGSGTFTLNVNRKPVLANAIPSQSIVVNTAYSYAFPANTFTDPNGTSLTYTATGMPDWMTFSPNYRKFTGTPPSSGPVTVTVTASDGVLSTSTTFVLTVTPGAGNQAPVVSLPIPDQTATEDQPFSYTFPAGTFTDSAGQVLTYTAVSVKLDGTLLTWPAWLKFDPTARSFTGTPPYRRTFYIKVTASDGALAVSDTFKLTVGSGGWSSQSFYTSDDASRWVAPSDDQLSSSGSTTGQVQQSYWFTYDGENRVKVVNGALVNGAILATAADSSYVLNYNAAGRVSSRMVKVNGTDMLEVSQYDLRGQLTYVYQPIALNAPTPAPGTAGALKEARYYDGRGRLVEQTTYYGNGETRDNVSITGWRKHTERYEYNADGQVCRQVTRGRELGWTVTAGHTVADEIGSYVLTELSVVESSYDKLGRSSGYSYRSRRHAEDYTGDADAIASFTHTYGISYQGRDAYLENQVWGNSNLPFYFKASTTQSVYDGWGRRIAIRESTPLPEDVGKIQDRIRYFSYDAEGMIVRRREGLLNDSNTFEQKTADLAKDELYAYANGQQVAKQTRGGNLELRTKLAAYQEAGGTDSTLSRKGSEWKSRFQTALGQYGNATDSAAPLDAVTHLTDYTAGPLGMGRVQVNSGDTLQSLAQRVYGNSGLWYVLADANAISSSSELIAGTSLRVPSVRVSANDASTFKPYDAAEIIGSTVPGLPFMLPPTGLTCKQVGILVVTTIIRIVAAYYGGTMGAMMADAAMQKVEQNTGIRDHYSLGQTVAMGIMAAGGAYASTLTGVAQAAMVAATAVTAYVAATEIDKARGEDVHFAWRNLLAAAATAVISNKLGAVGNSGNAAGGTVGAAANGMAFSWGQVAADTVRNLGIAAVNKGVTQLITGKKQNWDMTLMVADAFGNSLGNAIVGELKFQKSVRNLRPDQRASYDEQRDYGRSRDMALLNAQNLDQIQANTAALYGTRPDTDFDTAKIPGYFDLDSNDVGSALFLGQSFDEATPDERRNLQAKFNRKQQLGDYVQNGPDSMSTDYPVVAQRMGMNSMDWNFYQNEQDRQHVLNLLPFSDSTRSLSRMDGQLDVLSTDYPVAAQEIGQSARYWMDQSHGELTTLAQLRAMFPRATTETLDAYLPEFNRQFADANIDTPRRMAYFFATVAEETHAMTDFEESDFTYRDPARARGMFRNLRGMALDDIRALGNGERFANTIYAGIGNNGDAASGDGYRYRGRGLFQLTSRDNYRIEGSNIGVDLIADPDALFTASTDVQAAISYWNRKHLSGLADLLPTQVDVSGNVVRSTAFENAVRPINSGLQNILNRATYYNRYMNILNPSPY